MEGTFYTASDEQGSFVGILSQINQKLNKLHIDQEEQFLHLKCSIECIQQRISCLKKPVAMCPPGYFQGRISAKARDELSIHREVLQDNLEMLMKDVDLEHTELMDDLQTGECLTSDEAMDIIRKPTRRDQVRKLVAQLGRKSEVKFSAFLENMQKNSNYPHIAQNLITSYNKRKDSLIKSHGVRCITCVLKTEVLVKDVIDKLYSNRLLTAETFEAIADDPNLDNRLSWDIVLTQLKRSPDPRKTRHILQEALARKYEHVAARINKTQFPEVLCKCNDLKPLFNSGSLPSDTTGSLGDISTTSDINKFGRQLQIAEGLRTESISSLKSGSSFNVNFENIPNTVAWLESIPFENEVVTPDRLDSNIIDALVSESQSTILYDRSSGTVNDQFQKFESNSIKSFDLDSASTSGVSCSDRQSNEDATLGNFQPTYASVVSYNSGQHQTSVRNNHAQKSKNSTQSNLSETSARNQLNQKRNKTENTSKTRVQHEKKAKPVESLNEIGALFLSRSVSEVSTKTANKKACRKKGNQERHSTTNQIHKSKTCQNTSAAKKPDFDQVSNCNSAENRKILEEVFFAEQEKIHGDTSVKTGQTASRVNINCKQQETNDTSKQTGQTKSKRKKKNKKKKNC